MGENTASHFEKYFHLYRGLGNLSCILPSISLLLDTAVLMSSECERELLDSLRSSNSFMISINLQYIFKQYWSHEEMHQDVLAFYDSSFDHEWNRIGLEKREECLFLRY